jgi:putative redox protein
MHVELEQIGPAAFEARGGTGGSLVVDGSPDIGGQGLGMRPMELMLAAIASCSAMDIVHILRKQKEPLAKLTYRIEGAREDTTPAPFRKVRMHFVAHGPVDAHKFERAVNLGVEKYCSARASLDPTTEVSWTTEIRAESTGSEA